MPGSSPGAAIAVLAIAVFTLLLAGHPAPVSAQTAASPSDRIGPGDLVRVDVTGRADLSVTAAVDEQGGLTLPTLGTMRAAGRTTGELSADVSRRISLTLRETLQVRVSIVEVRSRKIFVLGAVLLPGAYSFKQDPTVWEAISEAGGATADANLVVVEIIPAEPTAERPKSTVDVAAAIRSGNYDGMPRLKPGDTVQVPRQGGGTSIAGEGSVIYIMGAVGQQGVHGLAAPSDLISTVIRSAPSQDADLSRIEIVRRQGGQVIQLTVNARDYLAQAQPNGNPELRPGDTIYVPRQARGFNFFSIIGYVSPVIALVTSIALLAR